MPLLAGDRILEGGHVALDGGELGPGPRGENEDGHLGGERGEDRVFGGRVADHGAPWGEGGPTAGDFLPQTRTVILSLA